MCGNGENGVSENELFGKRFQFAWEHFKFHAEQRTRMFNFYILFLGLFGSAFALLVKDSPEPFIHYIFLVFYAGGFISSIFLTLDIRNTQLVHQSEKILKKLESEHLFKGDDWVEDFGYGQIKLGILSREAILADFRKDKCRITSTSPFRFIFFDNITHTFSIRLIEFSTIILFWLLALATTPDPPRDELSIFEISIAWHNLTCWVFGLITLWSIWAMLRPDLDLNREPHALEWSQCKSQG